LSALFLGGDIVDIFDRFRPRIGSKIKKTRRSPERRFDRWPVPRVLPEPNNLVATRTTSTAPEAVDSSLTFLGLL
jgi:hypothetical protein